MTKCPGCQATLPDGAIQCQFCGAQFAASPPSGPTARTGRANSAGGGATQTRPHHPSGAAGAPRWVWPAYYGIAAWWIIDGLRTIVSILLVERAANGGGAMGIIGLLIGGAAVLVGIGLVLRIEVVRGIVNVMSFIQIIDGLLGVVFGFFMTGILGIWGAIAMIFSILRIATGGLMIYLIGETDSRAPNI